MMSLKCTPAPVFSAEILARNAPAPMGVLKLPPVLLESENKPIALL